MSYSIYLEIDTGGPGAATVHEVGNYTSNVTPMWYKALGFPLKELQGKPASECIELLERAIDHTQDPTNRDEYLALNPKNGWGNFDGAVEFLKRFLEGCRLHPKTTIYISY